MTPTAVGDLVLSGAVAGEIFVDSKTAGPYADGVELTLETGLHDVEVRDGQRVVARARVRVEPGGHSEAKLTRLAEPPPPPTWPPSPPVRPFTEPPVVIRPRPSAWPWGLVGVGAAGLAGAGGASGLGGGGAGGLVCEGPKVDCGGECIDVKASDTANCGECGRSCRGAACVVGACVPEALTNTTPDKGEVAPYALADDGAYVYWVSPAIKGVVDSSKMRRVAKAGGPAANEEEKVASGGTGLRAVELFGERVYWADGGAVRSAAKASPAEAREELTAAGRVEGLAVVASTGAGGAGGALGAGGVGGASGAGGAAGSGEPVLYVLTAEGRQLRAWRQGPGDDAPLLLGEVAAKADPYTGNPFGAAYVLVDDDYVYFADVGTLAGFNPDAVQLSNGDGAVYRVAR